MIQINAAQAILICDSCPTVIRILPRKKAVGRKGQGQFKTTKPTKCKACRYNETDSIFKKKAERIAELMGSRPRRLPRPKGLSLR